MADSKLYGYLAEFSSAADLEDAVRETVRKGYKQIEAYSPYPIESVCHLIEEKESNLPKAIFVGGCIGCLTGLLLQWGLTSVAYPYNIGGRPMFSWPNFIPIIFELTVLFSAFTAVFGMFALNGLPQPYHPVFNVPQFSLATKDKFFLCIEATDENYDDKQVKLFMDSLNPIGVYEVEP